MGENTLESPKESSFLSSSVSCFPICTTEEEEDLAWAPPTALEAAQSCAALAVYWAHQHSSIKFKHTRRF